METLLKLLAKRNHQMFEIVNQSNDKYVNNA